jgi:hypothetical protein
VQVFLAFTPQENTPLTAGLSSGNSTKLKFRAPANSQAKKFRTEQKNLLILAEYFENPFMNLSRA